MCVVARGGGLGWPTRQWRGFHRALTAEPIEIRRTLIALRASLARTAGDEMADRVELVLAEILNNIAEHGRKPRPGSSLRVRIDIWRQAGGMRCLVLDNGARVPPDCFCPGCQPSLDDLPEGGFGLHLVRSIAERIRYARLPGRNLLMLFVREGGSGV